MLPIDQVFRTVQLFRPELNAVLSSTDGRKAGDHRNQAGPDTGELEGQAG